MSKFHLYRGSDDEPKTVCGLDLEDVRPLCGNLEHRDAGGRAVQVPAGVDRCGTCFRNVAEQLVKPAGE